MSGIRGGVVSSSRSGPFSHIWRSAHFYANPFPHLRVCPSPVASGRVYYTASNGSIRNPNLGGYLLRGNAGSND